MPTPELSNSGLPLNVVDELVKVYSSAFDRVGEMVRNPWGKTQSSKDWKQARASVLGMQIDQILRSLNVDTSRWVGANLPQAFIDGINRAQTQARAAGIKSEEAAPLSVTGAFHLIDRRSIEIVARDTVGDLSKAADLTGKQAKSLLRQTAQQDLSEADINRMLAGGIIEGKPVQTIRNLRDQFRAVGDGKVRVKDKNGDMMEFEAGYYASMVVRTKTREATVMARHNRLEELGLDLVAIIGRPSKNFCSAYLGGVFSISGRSSKYPALSSLPSDGPPFHPNCSKSTRPFVEELASGKEIELSELDTDQEKMLVKDPSEAQRRFKDLQLYPQIKKRYASTAKAMFS